MNGRAGDRRIGTRRHAVSAPEVFIRRHPPVPSLVFDTYWYFASERQSIFHARGGGAEAPWTDDPVLGAYKFTNAYRASDRTSQFLIKRVIYNEDHDWPSTLLRVLLFKVFNKTATWNLLEASLGPMSLNNFSSERINAVLDDAIASGTAIYSNAYIMPSGAASMRQARKHRMHIALLSDIVRGSVSADIQKANSMEQAYNIIRSVPSFGPFLAMQFLVDLNYTQFLNFSEMDFVVPGPGARDGIRKCFQSLGDYDETDVIRWVAERQELELSTRGLEFKTLWGRPLQLIDCQNLFCEVDKYARVAHPEVEGRTGRTRIKQRFRAHAEQLTPWYPPKWGINEKIRQCQAAPGPSRE